jgi:hypothetical protein
MKKILLFILVYFLLFPLYTANAEEGMYINGYDWQKWTSGSKISFVQGWAKCGKAAVDNLFIDINKWNESIEFVKLQEDIFKDEGILIGGVTIRQIIDTVDKIYADPRVKTMDITEVMSFVSGRLIQGWTEKELDEVVAINVKLKQCEVREKKQGQVIEECSSTRKARNSYLQKLKKK